MAADNEKELQQLKKRMKELADKSYAHNIYTYTGFLSLAEQDVFWRMLAELKGTPYKLFGGGEECERQILRFGSSESLGYEEAFPITCLCISPLIEKFADNFNHRDFLGAILNLGIERSTVGDIFIREKSAYVFCTDKISPFIMDNLDKVKHTHVKCSIVNVEMQFIAKEPEVSDFTVSSERVDGMISRIYNLSRNQSLLLFRERKIYINGRLNENSSYILKGKDVVAVRGYGKFVYNGAKHETKKGKLSVSAGIYR